MDFVICNIHVYVLWTQEHIHGCVNLLLWETRYVNRHFNDIFIFVCVIVFVASCVCLDITAFLLINDYFTHASICRYVCLFFQWPYLKNYWSELLKCHSVSLEYDSDPYFMEMTNICLRVAKIGQIGHIFLTSKFEWN